MLLIGVPEIRIAKSARPRKVLGPWQARVASSPGPPFNLKLLEGLVRQVTRSDITLSQRGRVHGYAFTTSRPQHAVARCEYFSNGSDGTISTIVLLVVAS